MAVGSEEYAHERLRFSSRQRPCSGILPLAV
jgi:hypothetical protein